MKGRWTGTQWLALASLLVWGILQVLDMLFLHPPERPFTWNNSLGFVLYWLGSIVIFGFLVALFMKAEWQSKLTAHAVRVMGNPTYRHFALFILLSALVILVSLSFLLRQTTDPAGNQILYLVSVGFSQFKTFIYFMVFILLGLLIWVKVSVKPTSGNTFGRLEDKAVYSARDLIILLGLGIVQLITAVATFGSFYILVKRIPFRSMIQYWYFDYRDVIPDINLVLLAGIAIALTAILMLIVKIEKPWLYAALFLIGGLLQLLFPLIEEGNLGRIEFRAGRLGSGAYNTVVCQYEGVGALYENYEDYGPENIWISTKPPGFLVPVQVLKGLLKLVSPGRMQTVEECRPALKAFLTYASPGLSMLPLILIMLISRNLFTARDHFLPGLLFILMPNMILFTGMPDQFLIPGIFLVLVLFSVLASKKQSVLFAALTGIWYALCVNYSYALVGTLVFPLLLIGFHYLLDRSKKKFLRSMALIGVVLIAAVVTLWLWQTLTGFDLVQGFHQAMTAHRSFIRINDPWQQLGQKLIVNNSEYLLWIGLPTIMLFNTGLLAFFARKPSERPRKPLTQRAFLLASIAFYIVLNLAGQNKAEVARLWLFINGLVVLAAPMYLDALDPRKRKLIIGFYISLQVVWMYLLNQPFDDMFKTVHQVGLLLSRFISL